MPGIYSPSPSRVRSDSRTSYFDAAPGFAYTSETSAHQVTADHETRKRSRYSEAESSAAARDSTTSYWGQSSVEDARFDNTKSPAPLANDRYTLAGGGMSGAQGFTRQTGDYDDYFQLQRQRGNWSVPPTPYNNNTMARHEPTDGMQTTPGGSKSWTIFGFVGGVAGRLFQFCTVPFRGFQAGNGQKYNADMQTQSEVAAKLGLHDDPFSAGPVQVAATTPGDFPPDNYGVRSIDSVSEERPRLAKRLRTADTWVVVDTKGESESRPSTPRLSERRVPSHTRSPSYIPRPVSRASTSTTPSIKRPSLIPVSRRSTMDRRSFHSTTNNNNNNTSSSSTSRPALHSHQRSYPSSRQILNSPTMLQEKQKQKSPLPKESQRLINKVRREEMEEDARMRRMSSQMSAMLREAKEALGAKFEVMEYDDDSSGDGDDDRDERGVGGGVQQPAWFS